MGEAELAVEGKGTPGLAPLSSAIPRSAVSVRCCRFAKNQYLVIHLDQVLKMKRHGIGSGLGYGLGD